MNTPHLHPSPNASCPNGYLAVARPESSAKTLVAAAVAAAALWLAPSATRAQMLQASPQPKLGASGPAICTQLQTRLNLLHAQLAYALAQAEAERLGLPQAPRAGDQQVLPRQAGCGLKCHAWHQEADRLAAERAAIVQQLKAMNMHSRAPDEPPTWRGGCEGV